MSKQAARAAGLLFVSGACALVYQTTWLREFRLVFGASTAASAAVLAIFIGGLGLGARLLGARADRHPYPLRLYAGLETGIAVAAAASPLLLWLVRQVYVGLGGTQVLGGFVGGGLRLVLSALVLAVPTVLMGGTLPAAARFVESEQDAGRRLVALLYGVNTVGAVAGAFLSTFFLLEAFGNRRTLLLAGLVNLLLAVVAWSWSRRTAPVDDAAAPRPGEAAAATAAAPFSFVLAASGLVGFAFFLMEIVWYRTLGPLLGGSVFTFGLILSCALLGIGLGGTLYSLSPPGKPARLTSFALTCLLEAACIGLPFALGDHLAVFALALRPLGDVGFYGHVLAWSIVTSVVVLPTAIVAGAQFPMLIALLGRGRSEVGRHIGQAYLWNTGGAILGSLAGGFGLLPLLSAVGCWRLVAWLLWALGLAAIALSLRRTRPAPAHAIAAALLVATPLLVAAPGPTAAWRHAGIGAGRAQRGHFDTPNGYRRWLLAERWSVPWEREGVESSVALQVRQHGITFVVNGKSDGHATVDGPTQVMSGLLAAALHREARTAMVVGLGTGSTGGWLGVLPGIERVDIVELEGVILDVARALAAVNRDVLANPRVHVSIGDAREVLLTTRGRYDIVLSEPSNPYRAGVASLFTLDFYDAVAARLEPGGIFVQWLQPYEVDVATVLSIYRTLGRVFPHVQTWRTHGDLLLLASRESLVIDPPRLRARLASEPFATALRDTWRVTDLEGFLARFVAGDGLGASLRPAFADLVNTDDVNQVEFGFARSVGRAGTFGLRGLRSAARQRGFDRPRLTESASVDWGRVAEESARLYGDDPATPGAALTPDARARLAALALHQRGDLDGAAQAWLAQGHPPRGLAELVAVAESLGRLGRDEGRAAVDALAGLRPAEADLVRGFLAETQGAVEPGVEALERAFTAMRQDPWSEPRLAQHGLDSAARLAAAGLPQARRLYRALREPLAARAMEFERVNALVEIALTLDPAEACVDVLGLLEPYPIWTSEMLGYRARCYVSQHHSLAAAAERDLRAFLRAEPFRLEDGLVPPPPGR